METTTPSQCKIEERIPWYKPVVERLSIHLDTGFSPGSITDGEDGSLLIE